MTPHIKKKIKAIQRAFTSGNATEHRKLCHKVSMLIKKAKKDYHNPSNGIKIHFSLLAL